MRLRVFIAAGCWMVGALFAVLPGSAQSLPMMGSGSYGPYERQPEEVEILGISVEGVENESTQNYVLQSSGLSVGQTVLLPGDPAFGEAIRSIYRLGLFDNVKIVEERRVGDGAYLAIQVNEVPRLRDYAFTGVKRSHRKDLQEKVPLIRRMPVRVGDIERAEQVIKEFYEEKGNLLAEVDIQRTVHEDNSVELEFAIDRGPRVEVGNIVFQGNEAISDRSLRRQMDETKEDRWWRFWKKETFQEDEFETDVQNIINFYNEKGYYDAQIVRDSVYLDREGKDPEVIVALTVREGPQYHIRYIEWEGNTVYSDAVLTQSLGFEEGDVFNQTQLDENLYGNRRSSDVSSLYMNRGYMRFNAQPTIRVVEGDSLDLAFDVFEGDVYDFGTINIAGNDKTKEHVIRRELYTIPGETFSRDAIQESVRRLMQLSYFSQESLAGGPGVNIDEQRKVVDLAYNVEEVGSDQLELSGTWGRFGLILMLRFGFNNVSIQNFFKKGAWKPIPAGDGQKLSLGIQTNGRYYQSYSLSFTEPWFRGKPTPVGFSLSHSRIGRNPYTFSSTEDTKFITTSARVFYDRRLRWPDDRFNLSTGLRYQYYNIEGTSFTSLPDGLSQELTFQQSLSRSSLDNPMFPTSGSEVSLSAEIAPPIPGFIQYHKWRFTTEWNVPLASKLSVGVSSDYGYIGSLTGDDVEFQRFLVGGSPFETQGFNAYYFGSDVVYMRGYPARSVGPRRDGQPVGGSILNKYSAELRLVAIQSPQVSAAPYLFVDAANSWDGFSSYDPTKLYRSAGVGARLFLPILGMLEITYGYNFDEFAPITNDHTGESRWLFQFSLGQGFD